jgi:dihydroorotate dehydrogenase (NAD+) catalytic subunit
MINAIGLQNPGSDVVINDIMPRLDKTETRSVLMTAKPSVPASMQRCALLAMSV